MPTITFTTLKSHITRAADKVAHKVAKALNFVRVYSKVHAIRAVAAVASAGVAGAAKLHDATMPKRRARWAEKIADFAKVARIEELTLGTAKQGSARVNVSQDKRTGQRVAKVASLPKPSKSMLRRLAQQAEENCGLSPGVLDEAVKVAAKVGV